jgi:uncharacterized protein (DUF433 family)
MRRWGKTRIFFVTLSLLLYLITIPRESRGDSQNLSSHFLDWYGDEKLTPEELKERIEIYLEKYPEYKSALDELGLTIDKLIKAREMFTGGNYTMEELLADYGLEPEQIIEVFGETNKEVAHRKLRENEHYLKMNYSQLREEIARQREQHLSGLYSQLGITKEELLETFESGKSLREFLKEKGISIEQFRNALGNLWLSR